MNSLAIAVMTVGIALQASSSPEIYVRAAVGADETLHISVADGREVVLRKERDDFLQEEQVSFSDVAISVDRRTVGWFEYFTNCCTSYPIVRRLGVYRDGSRKVLIDGRPLSAWMFVGSGTQLACLSEPLHGPNHQVYWLVDVASGQVVATYARLEGDKKAPASPRWVRALDQKRSRHR